MRFGNIHVMSKKYDDIVLDLKVLSQIPSNGRLRRIGHGKFTLEDDGFLVPLKRLLYRDSRQSALKDIEATLNGTFEFVRLLLDSKHLKNAVEDGNTEARTIVMQLNNIFRELSKSQIGLRNLRETYSGDANAVAKLDWYMERTEEELNWGRFETARFSTFIDTHGPMTPTEDDIAQDNVLM